MFDILKTLRLIEPARTRVYGWLRVTFWVHAVELHTPVAPLVRNYNGKVQTVYFIPK